MNGGNGERHVKPLTPAQKWLAGITGLMGVTLAGLAFVGMFSAVRLEMTPFFGRLAWIVPAGIDIGIMVLTSYAILLEWRDMPMPALRWIAMTFMGFSVWLNIAAADGSLKGEIGHAGLPILFISCVEAVRHTVRRQVGLATGSVREGIPLARWLLAPGPAFLMMRRMVLQRIHSYPEMVDLEKGRRRARARLRAAYGTSWRKNAPEDLVWMLKHGESVPEAIERTEKLVVPLLAGTGTPQHARGGRHRGGTGTRVDSGTALAVTEPGTGTIPAPGTALAVPEPRRAIPAPGTPRALAAPAPRQIRSFDELVRAGMAAEAAAGRRLGAKALRAELSCNYQAACAVARELHPADSDGQEAAAR